MVRALKFLNLMSSRVTRRTADTEYRCISHGLILSHVGGFASGFFPSLREFVPTSADNSITAAWAGVRNGAVTAVCMGA